MLIATRFYAGITKNGNSKRLVVIQDSNNYSGNIVKVIKYSVNCVFAIPPFYCPHLTSQCSDKARSAGVAHTFLIIS